MIANYVELNEYFAERMTHIRYDLLPLDNSIKICWENDGKKFSEKYTFITNYKNIVIDIRTLESFTPAISEERCVSKIRLNKFLQHAKCVAEIVDFNLSENEQDLEVKIKLIKG